jgi:dienelactone hydrolase
VSTTWKLTWVAEPLFLSCSEIDHTFPPDARNKAVEILQDAKKSYQLQVFSGVEHGFALRCNLNNPYERKWKSKFTEFGLLTCPT